MCSQETPGEDPFLNGEYGRRFVRGFQGDGTCTDCGTLCYICDCVVGWRGKSCETD